MKHFDRRQFVKIAGLLASSLVVSTHSNARVLQDKSIGDAKFTHGIASGDPSQQSVILWTRAVPSNSDKVKSVSLKWQIALDKSFSKLVREGFVESSYASDFTAKIDVQELSPNQSYYYRFISNNNISPIGKTRTLPSGSPDKVSFAVFSCSNYPAGYFTPYSIAAKQADIDFVLHLGDYIYEYAADGYATEKAKEIGRDANDVNQHEVITLADYRNRYALYRTDQGLQDIHAAAPFIPVWDDHEITNDTYKTGAENHNEGEGDFFERRAAAIQAYYEWLPIRPPRGESSPEIYRSFDFGDLLSLHMLDTRVIGRDKQLAYAEYMDQSGQLDAKRFTTDLTQANRTLLGQQQFSWLQSQIMQSKAKWQLLGQQVLMGKMLFPAEVLGNRDLTKVPSMIADLAKLKRQQANNSALNELDEKRLATKAAYNLDAWDGYPMERERLYQVLLKHNKRFAVVAGDTHNAWCNQLSTHDGKLVGYEFATPGVSSPGMEKYLSIDSETANTLANDLTDVIEDLQYCNLHQRGYLTVTVTPSNIEAKWSFVETVLKPSSKVVNTKTIKV